LIRPLRQELRSRGIRAATWTAVLGLLLLPGPGLHTPCAGATAAGARHASPIVTGVESVGMTVSEMDRSIAFFTGVLDFEKVSDVEVAGEDHERLQGVFGARLRVVRLRLGREILDLTEYLAPRGRPIPVDAKSNDRSFQHVAIIVSDMDRAYARLRQHRVAHASSGPQTLPAWNRAAGGIRAFYFRDPDGHNLEVLMFPPGKGDPRWQDAGGRLFLGIDHTAIVVADTETSLRLYRDVLGMRVAGESENYGTEQEHLNNVFGARLRITALRAASGLGIEFLEYLAPRDGRPAPEDLRSNDLLHWQTRLEASDPSAATASLRTAGTRFVSPGAVRLGEATLGFREGLLVRDPDGHALLLAGPGGGGAAADAAQGGGPVGGPL
jgi:catechol 2,3-dioxygenase-like lactoylglutathione lyase family enzyme